ncbi:hypothetical protein [Paenibacillus lutrae]|uniref:Uncharacterized protein n=1 Tax=Paenibacillus lutrae TaxID=2078573 RepID=A0A7X3FIK5_9BACL|nr:hypothetical protein [Paenibacillus lutrae]MVP00365.1 hypothetical protein [Paenibacillus lutrae]
MNITWTREVVTMYIGRDDQGRIRRYESRRPKDYVEPVAKPRKGEIRCSPKIKMKTEEKPSK